MEEKQRLEMVKEEERKLEKQKLEQQRIERTRFEERRKQEEKEYRRQQEMLRAQIECEKDIERQRNKELKQEELDAEIARRLAREDSAIQMVENNASRKEKSVDTSKYDLKKYKYVELRDIINTSTDTHLLLACKEEFHRRLQIYQQWKELNESSIVERQKNRLPMAILASSNKDFSSHFSQNNTAIQRYFKVPFARPARGQMNMHDILEVAVSHGMWYAHFDGQWIARQMELHPNKKPVLLIAGQDDMEMCELSLDATQLTRKKGAEITAAEFETLWYQCGGPEYHIRSKHEKN
ncbi:unnamed protein product [Onchocerca ochengi]|uniref:Myosin-VI_CBD domain-containing protein n=1 Tax=Onchocerca ochengi TaxID=42157 RepID=A0A182DX22_ONCOC|nr:unnamed protein product [Onchocerca ochengi]